jgi:hypothetical protein
MLGRVAKNLESCRRQCNPQQAEGAYRTLCARQTDNACVSRTT